MQDAIEAVELAVEALEALRDGADDAGGFGCENRLREHARRRLVDALAALDVDHMRPMGVAR